MVITTFISRQVGWMQCIACSDSKRLVGRMWLGVTPGGSDIFAVCPECQGTGRVARYKHFDVTTGLEIDYERPGQQFVQLMGGQHGA